MELAVIQWKVFDTCYWKLRTRTLECGRMRRIYTFCGEKKKRKRNREEKDKSTVFIVSNFERECARLKVA
jgi:hypothetical protein